MNMIFHADDFGITPEQSKRILACSLLTGGQGVLNSTSMLVNTARFEECAQVLDPFVAGPDESPKPFLVGLHLNIVEGYCVAEPAEVPLLVDENGMFCCSFVDILRAGRGEQATELQHQLALELGAQIDRFVTRFPGLQHHLRLDSHQHFHLIPVVFEALMEALEKRTVTVEYLRIPAEPTSPFLGNPRVWPKVPPINWAKHVLLNHCWKKSRIIAAEHAGVLMNAHSAVFCGICFSGHMFSDRVPKVAAALKSRAQEGVTFPGFAPDMTGTDVEFLFHPGGYENTDDALNPALDGFVDFYTSPNRMREAETLQRWRIR